MPQNKKLDFDCLSEFQKFGLCKIYQIMTENKIPEFDIKVVMPTARMEEYGLTMKFHIKNEYPIFWIHPESYQVYIHANDEYGKTVEKYDTNDDFQEFIKSFEADFRNHFTF